MIYRDGHFLLLSKVPSQAKKTESMIKMVNKKTKKTKKNSTAERLSIATPQTLRIKCKGKLGREGGVGKKGW